MMFDLSKLPETISRKITGREWNCDNIGMSDSTILLFDEMVLKIQITSRSSKHEKKLLGWLDGKLPVPKIIEAETRNGYSFLLMSKLPGEMSCSDKSLQNIENTVTALANGLKMLWQIDISNCPCSNVVSEKLIQAKYNIENDLVDIDNFEPETNGYEDIGGISGLYDFLNQNRPTEDVVFSHGDFCLPNVFVSGCDTTGFLDWGNGGIADRWQDIALCVRSLQHNHMEYSGYGENDYQKYKTLLFQELGLAPDEEKIRYYIMLDEFF
jgi:kanamycin kinase/aminoglycoside 3'-phosphotransferase-3